METRNANILLSKYTLKLLSTICSGILYLGKILNSNSEDNLNVINFWTDLFKYHCIARLQFYWFGFITLILHKWLTIFLFGRIISCPSGEQLYSETLPYKVNKRFLNELRQMPKFY